MKAFNRCCAEAEIFRDSLKKYCVLVWYFYKRVKFALLCKSAIKVSSIFPIALTAIVEKIYFAYLIASCDIRRYKTLFKFYILIKENLVMQ